MKKIVTLPLVALIFILFGTGCAQSIDCNSMCNQVVACLPQHLTTNTEKCVNSCEKKGLAEAAEQCNRCMESHNTCQEKLACFIDPGCVKIVLSNVSS